MSCLKCKDQGFINKEPTKIIKKYFCKINETETITTIEVGGIDICPRCQKQSEAEYQAQLGAKCETIRK
tara:strand:+ start:29623 stop:29829 length:207 start_codon:yes stop_codon:yes gene_type:complete